MIVENMIAGNSVTKTREGWAASYSYLVQFEEPPQNSAAFVNAGGVPAIGDACPDYSAIVAVSKSLEMRDPCTAVVTVQFAGKTVEGNGVQLSITASLASEMTNLDLDGDLIAPVYSKKAGKSPDKVTPMVPKLVPSIVITAKRLLKATPLQMIATVKQNTATMNNEALFGISGSQDKMLCTRISAEHLADELYQITYEFQYRPISKDKKSGGWDALCVLNDKQTGLPWAKASFDDGSMRWLQVYPHSPMPFNP